MGFPREAALSYTSSDPTALPAVLLAKPTFQDPWVLLRALRASLLDLFWFLLEFWLSSGSLSWGDFRERDCFQSFQVLCAASCAIARFFYA